MIRNAYTLKSRWRRHAARGLSSPGYEIVSFDVTAQVLFRDGENPSERHEGVSVNTSRRIADTSPLREDLAVKLSRSVERCASAARMWIERYVLTAMQVRGLRHHSSACLRKGLLLLFFVGLATSACSLASSVKVIVHRLLLEEHDCS